MTKRVCKGSVPHGGSTPQHGDRGFSTHQIGGSTSSYHTQPDYTRQRDNILGCWTTKKTRPIKHPIKNRRGCVLLFWCQQPSAYIIQSKTDIEWIGQSETDLGVALHANGHRMNHPLKTYIPIKNLPGCCPWCRGSRSPASASGRRDTCVTNKTAKKRYSMATVPQIGTAQGVNTQWLAKYIEQ